jgi:hypothetical protein
VSGGLNWQCVIARLSDNASKVKHGEAGVILKIHEGKIVHVTHTVTETSREPGGPIAGVSSSGCEDQKPGELVVNDTHLNAAQKGKSMKGADHEA